MLLGATGYTAGPQQYAPGPGQILSVHILKNKKLLVPRFSVAAAVNSARETSGTNGATPGAASDRSNAKAAHRADLIRKTVLVIWILLSGI